MLADIDAICKRTGVWPHVVLSANAQNYQRFTRTVDNMQIPYIVAGNGGHSVARLEEEREPELRVPTALALDGDNVILENYDDTGLRLPAHYCRSRSTSNRVSAGSRKSNNRRFGRCGFEN
jgi:hypothetical protein